MGKDSRFRVMYFDYCFQCADKNLCLLGRIGDCVSVCVLTAV